MAVFEFIEGWYNPHRRHSSSDYLLPVNYERKICPTRTPQPLQCPAWVPSRKPEKTLRYLNVTVQLPRTEKANDYLNKYFDNIELKVFWGSAEEFATELWKRWTEGEA